MLTFKIEGLDKLERELQGLGSSIADCLEDGVIAGGMIIANQGVNNAPFKTGNLKSSIVADGKKATPGDVSVTRSGKYRVEGVVGPRNCVYARIQEYGGVTGRGYKTRIQGKFYMTRAVESHRKQAEEEMVRVITEGINR